MEAPNLYVCSEYLDENVTGMELCNPEGSIYNAQSFTCSELFKVNTCLNFFTL